MKKSDLLDSLFKENKGILTTSDAVKSGGSKTYFMDYVKKWG